MAGRHRIKVYCDSGILGFAGRCFTGVINEGFVMH